jgi:hypothetical protein
LKLDDTLGQSSRAVREHFDKRWFVLSSGWLGIPPSRCFNRV